MPSTPRSSSLRDGVGIVDRPHVHLDTGGMERADARRRDRVESDRALGNLHGVQPAQSAPHERTAAHDRSEQSRGEPRSGRARSHFWQ